MFLTEKEWRELKGRFVRIRNKFGGIYVGTVGTVRKSRKWKGRLKVFLYDIRIFYKIRLVLPRPLRMTPLVRRPKNQRFAQVYSKCTNSRSFFIDDAEFLGFEDFMPSDHLRGLEG